MNLRAEIERYSKLNGYQASDYSEIACSCGGKRFKLFSDDEEGGAYAVCSTCQKELDLEDSRQYIEVATQNICTCDNKLFTVAVSKAYYQDSTDPRWVYVGCHCSKCDISGVYADWKQS